MEYAILFIGWTIGISLLWTFRFEWIGLFLTLFMFTGIVSLTFRIATDTTNKPNPVFDDPFFQIAFFTLWFASLLVQLCTTAYLGLFFIHIWKEFNRRATFAEFTRGLFEKWRSIKMAWTFGGFFALFLMAFSFSMFVSLNGWIKYGLGTGLLIGLIVSSIVGLVQMISLYKARHNIQPRQEPTSTKANIKPIYPFDELMRHNTIAQLSNYSFR